MPSLRQVRNTREAISARFATRTRRIIGHSLSQTRACEGLPATPGDEGALGVAEQPMSAAKPLLALSRRSRASWPEHPEPVGALVGLVLDHREADAEHGAGVAGVDHAVVVEHAGEEERQR